MSGATPPASDVQLLSASAAGDHDAFAALVARHQASAFRFALTLTATRELAEDVLQQAMLAAWRAAATFRGDASVRSWILTIVRNTAYHDRLRRHREPLDERSLDDLGLEAGWGVPTQDRALIEREQREALARALARLPDEERAVIVLRDFEGLAGDDAASVLHLSLPALKSRLHRARLRLAAEVRREMTHVAR